MGKEYNSHTYQDYTATADMEQGSAVKISGSNIVKCTASTDDCIGLLERAVDNGDSKISVVHSGRFGDARLGATVSEGDDLAPAADGKLGAVAAGDTRVAQVLHSAADGDVGVPVEVYANKTTQ